MRKFLSDEIDTLVNVLRDETDVGKQKVAIEIFYNEHFQKEADTRIANTLGKWITWFFLGMNILVVALILILFGIDIFHHLDAPENRFVDGGVLGGLITATIAQAMAAFIIYAKVIFK